MRDHSESSGSHGSEPVPETEARGYLAFFLVTATITHITDLSIGLAIVATLLLIAIWVITGIAFDDANAPDPGGAAQ
ncbi:MULTISPECIES: hypothetical protein [Nocardia]|uniref:hypothetical protein n=1 Tax=Nocardia TaxID=1817 RepID=UPI0024542F0F|nr:MULTISPECIES: hypothetical protein [Nocardia]